MPRQHHEAATGAYAQPPSPPHPSLIALFRLLAISLLLTLALPAKPALAAPQLWLPTPSGETWKIIQGYGCGSHNGWDRYSLDIVNSDGRTFGAPVRAAADGTIWNWTAKSGTLILDHGGGFYTMYTHLSSVVTTAKDKFVAHGTVIGAVGDRAAHGLAHLHFTAFTGRGIAANGRKSVALRFADGYDLPETGGCNQHGGTQLKATGERVTAGISFSGAEQGRWYNGKLRIDFYGAGRGFSQAWDRDPGGDAPQFSNADSGFVELEWVDEGLHTLYIRAWDEKGNQTLATYGPIGRDLTPPSTVAKIAPVTVSAGAPAPIGWGAASDGGAGVAGYHVYVGTDANGTSDWFTDKPQVGAPSLAAGRYLLRVRSIDFAGNAGEWSTIGEVVSQ
jgi:murein DD-endopeptidase MepM/ murein hydrolase activator NlpD